MADTTSKVVQVDWLDYWFKPKLKVVSYGKFIETVTELQSQQAKIFSVDVDKANGRYKISYQQTSNDKQTGLHASLAHKTQGTT